MAVYNEIGIGRWNRFIQKLTDIKGGPPARQLSSEIVFQHPIFHGVENRYLESWDLFGQGLSNGPIAGQLAGVRITNPNNSNVVVVVQKAMASVAAATFVNLEYGQVGAGLSNSAGPTIPMESRGRSASTALISFNAGPLSTLNNISQTPLVANTPYDFILDGIHEICLPPGNSLQIDESLVNTQISVTFWWRERFLEPAERK
jgi:hypothetical protein